MKVIEPLPPNSKALGNMNDVNPLHKQVKTKVNTHSNGLGVGWSANPFTWLNIAKVGTLYKIFLHSDLHVFALSNDFLPVLLYWLCVTDWIKLGGKLAKKISVGVLLKLWRIIQLAPLNRNKIWYLVHLFIYLLCANKTEHSLMDGVKWRDQKNVY